jgi:hypothetical protein
MWHRAESFNSSQPKGVGIMFLEIDHLQLSYMLEQINLAEV